VNCKNNIQLSVEKVYEKNGIIELKLTHYAVSYKMQLCPAKLKRNSSYRCTFSKSL